MCLKLGEWNSLLYGSLRIPLRNETSMIVLTEESPILSNFAKQLTQKTAAGWSRTHTRPTIDRIIAKKTIFLTAKNWWAQIKTGQFPYITFCLLIQTMYQYIPGWKEILYLISTWHYHHGHVSCFLTAIPSKVAPSDIKKGGLSMPERPIHHHETQQIRRMSRV